MMGASIGRACRRIVGGMLVVAIMAAVGCAGRTKEPQWVHGKPKGYPEKQYVTGVGQGPDAEAAASAARAEIARQTKGESEGIEIAKTWVARKPPIHWALAVLDREALVTRLSDELTPTEKQLAETLGGVASAPPESAIDGVLRAIALAQRRDALLARIVNLGGTPPSSETSPTRAALDEQLAAIKNALAIEVDAYEMDATTGAIGEPLDEIRRTLAQQVLARGFALPPESDWGDTPAWLLARARVSYERLELDRGGEFVAVHWEAALEIVDRAAGNKVLALLTDESRATHLNEREARRQAQEAAETFLAEAFAGWLDEHYTPKS